MLNEDMKNVEMIKERPLCRRALLRLIAEKEISLEDIAYRRIGKVGYFTDGMVKQAKKMLYEQGRK